MGAVWTRFGAFPDDFVQAVGVDDCVLLGDDVENVGRELLALEQQAVSVALVYVDDFDGAAGVCVDAVEYFLQHFTRVQLRVGRARVAHALGSRQLRHQRVEPIVRPHEVFFVARIG